ncbi:hypothetical protein CPB97_000682 [Podila verticillata]|nr:hypothetical protein CPB97_000682 [Podila verticillata]
MLVKDYGVWAATPTSFELDTRNPNSPHIHLKFRDDTGENELIAAINVRSIDSDSRLVYWLNENLQHRITDRLKVLDRRFHPISARDGQGLDYIRQKLVNVSEGQLLEFGQPGPDNIVEKIAPILQRAIDARNTTFIFGSKFSDENGQQGIHDIHMNQGSLPQFAHGIFQDGAIIVYVANSDHWEAIFLAFSSQRIPTDRRGLSSADSPELKALVDQLGS